ncbi:MAG: maleylpyruvate isomerase family mycothiol-dependent enzyme [Actinomycetota bacterium]
MHFEDHTRPAHEAREVADAHRTLLEHLRAAPNARKSAPSALRGWTIGHVVAHLAQSADSHVELLSGRPQYEGGAPGRATRIDAGADRPWAELLADAERAFAAVEAAYAGVESWSTPVSMLAGPVSAGYLPLIRRREIEVHRLDLRLGATVDQIDRSYLARDLGFLEAWLTARSGEIPAPILELDATDRWLWMVGRLDVRGVEPAGLF